MSVTVKQLHPHFMGEIGGVDLSSRWIKARSMP